MTGGVVDLSWLFSSDDTQVTLLAVVAWIVIVR